MGNWREGNGKSFEIHYSFKVSIFILSFFFLFLVLPFSLSLPKLTTGGNYGKLNKYRKTSPTNRTLVCRIMY